MVKYMYTIKKDYNKETKDILKKLNNEWYNFSRISIHLKNNFDWKDKIEQTNDSLSEINKNIMNVANLLNNPKKNRTEEDV